MRRKSGVILVLIGLLVVLTTGCDMMSERFLPDPVEDRSIDNAALPVPATSRNQFTFLDEVLLEKGGETIVEIGVYNDLPVRSTILIASPDTRIGFGEVETESTVFCRDENEYEYTIEFDSPIINISVGEAMGFEVIITDKHSITAETLTCPISLFDVQSSKLLTTKELNITVVSAME